MLFLRKWIKILYRSHIVQCAATEHIEHLFYSVIAKNIFCSSVCWKPHNFFSDLPSLWHRCQACALHPWSFRRISQAFLKQSHKMSKLERAQGLWPHIVYVIGVCYRLISIENEMGSIYNAKSLKKIRWHNCVGYWHGM